MRQVLIKLLEFLREIERGQAVMRGDLAPGAHDPRRGRRFRGRRTGLRCGIYKTRTLRHAPAWRRKERSGE